MYEKHFGLAKKPFVTTPSPRFIFLGSSHREALASLICGVREGWGFISLGGEVGTGKTTLLRALLEELDASLKTVLITHTTLTKTELLRTILDDLDIPAKGLRRVEMIRALHQFLLDEVMAGRKPPVLIIDEAQNLQPEVLEEIRLLSNLETGESKLIQVILAGQPELQTKLDQPNLRQLRQRIAARAHLEPLDYDETVAYVRHRLNIAGGADPDLFTPKALFRVWKASGGIPRVINIVCEQGLVFAYGAERKRVVSTVVSEVSRSLGLDPGPEIRTQPAAAQSSTQSSAQSSAPVRVVIRLRRPGWAATAAVAAFALLAIGYFMVTYFSGQS